MTRPSLTAARRAARDAEAKYRAALAAYGAADAADAARTAYIAADRVLFAALRLETK